MSDRLSQPWDFKTAREQCRAASSAQKKAENDLKEAAKEAAEAEEEYRTALAIEILRLHDEDGVAWSVAPDLARGNEEVAELRREWKIKQGVSEARAQACWRRVANRKDAQRFADWSQRREMSEAYGHTEEPDWSTVPVIGGRQAA